MTASHNIAVACCPIAGNTAKETRVGEEAAMDTIDERRLVSKRTHQSPDKGLLDGVEIETVIGMGDRE